MAEIDFAAELARGIACQRAGHPSRALAALANAAAAGAPRPIAAQAHVRLSVVHRNLGQWHEALDHARRAGAVAAQANEPLLLLEARNVEAAVYLQRREFDSAGAILREVLRDAGTSDEPSVMKVRGLALSNLGTIRAEGGALEEARQFFAAAHTCFRLAEYGFGIPLSLHNLGAVCLDLGEFDEALGYLIEARGEAQRLGDLELASLAGMNIGEAVARGGDPERAGDYVGEAIGGFSAAGNRSRHSYALGVYALIAELCGELDTARAAYRSGVQKARELGLLHLQERYGRQLERLSAALEQQPG